MKRLQDFIYVERNALSESLRRIILQEYVGSNEWKESHVGDTSILDKMHRDVSEINVSHQNVIGKNSEVRGAIDKELFSCAGVMLAKYQTKFAGFTFVPMDEDEGYIMLRYKANQFYNEHTDSMRLNPRTVSCSFALNDDYEGGEWSFFGGAYVTRINAGDAILFPSNFLFPHSIRPVLSGVRYSIVTWFK